MAAALGADAMSVSAAVGVRWHGRRQKFRLAWHMGLFQFLMPLAGWALGAQLAGLIHRWGAYVAAALVFAIGAKMFYEALGSRPGNVAEAAGHAAEKAMGMQTKDPTRGWSLMMLSVATSLDALVAGVSLALGDPGACGSIWTASLIIGIVAAAMSLTGVLLGQHIGKAVGRPAEFAGAVVLMALAVSFLWV